MLGRSIASTTPLEPGAPRKMRVETLKPERKDSRVGGNTKELKRLQRRDGYHYTLKGKEE